MKTMNNMEKKDSPVGNREIQKHTTLQEHQKRQECTEPQEDLPLERHPWPPFIPEGAKVLVMGTFPPGNHRWSMEFYYPNRTNDFSMTLKHCICQMKNDSTWRRSRN